ncbi:MAG: ribosomal protein S18-alanine N-acetyltransferase [Lacrimispora sp.]
MVHEMGPEDISGISKIEERCFSDFWSRESVREGLESSLDTWLVLKEKEGVLGYCVFRIIAGEGELLRIAVSPEFQGRGLSKKLMDQMVEYSRKKKAETMFLEVRESNEKARNLYRSYGFSEEGIRKDYYRDPVENAVIMKACRI